MANVLYPKFKESLLSQSPDVDLDTDTIKVALVSSSYTYSTSDQYYSAVSGVIGTPATLASKTVTNGVFDAADVTFTSVTSTATVTRLIIYKEGTNAASSPLIAFLDSATSGLPVTPNGGDITISWDNGASKIFAL
jgi:hypothetical protein